MESDAFDSNAFVSAYWHWAGVPTMLGCPYRPDFGDTDIGLVGFPYSGGNAVERMQYLGPRAVRSRSTAYRRTPRFSSSSPFDLCRVRDLGDVALPNILSPDLAAADAEAFYRKIDERGIVPVSVGGDHSITLPIIRAIAGPGSRHKEPIGMIHLDSHTDTYGPLAGTYNNAGNAFRAGVEEGLLDPARTLQLGLNGSMASPLQEAWSREHFRVIDLQDMLAMGIERVVAEVRRVVGSGRTYISLDLDVLDLPYAPAVADPEVGGLSQREFFALLEGLAGVNVCGADIVCLCPPLDGPGQITTLMACETLLTCVALAAMKWAKK